MVIHNLNCHRYCIDCHVYLGACVPIDHMEIVHGWNLTCEHCGYQSFHIDSKDKRTKRKHREVCVENARKLGKIGDDKETLIAKMKIQALLQSKKITMEFISKRSKPSNDSSQDKTLQSARNEINSRNLSHVKAISKASKASLC